MPVGTIAASRRRGGAGGGGSTYKHIRLVVDSYGSGGAFIATEIEFMTSDDTDWSETGTATYSGFGGWYPASYAFDNNGGSIVETNSAAPVSIGCTLTVVKAITKVAITTYAGYHNRCLRTGKLQGSNGAAYADGPWIDILTIPDQGTIWGSGERRVFSV